MDDLRRFRITDPFQYKGNVFRAILYYKGNSDLVHSWDIVIGRVNVSKSLPDDRRAMGITAQDLEAMNQRVASYIEHLEGR